jgi:hypothetical protein
VSSSCLYFSHSLLVSSLLFSTYRVPFPALTNVSCRSQNNNINLDLNHQHLQVPSSPASSLLQAYFCFSDPETLATAVRVQVEYYFSKENLRTDTFLQSKMDANSAVPLATVMAVCLLSPRCSSPHFCVPLRAVPKNISTHQRHPSSNQVPGVLVSCRLGRWQNQTKRKWSLHNYLERDPLRLL